MKKIKAEKDEKTGKQIEAKIEEEREKKQKMNNRKDSNVNGWKINSEKQPRDRKNKR